MEHHVIIEKLCSCAKKEGMSQISSYETKESAKSAAEAQLGFISSSFCGKHKFDLTEVNDNFVIGMLPGGCGCGSHDKH
ncbi:MAG: hypothetical protein GW906_02820 [Epsilonproteobacteria bacterium]|nr:hypothetical protein [Campylobacterota bacterium]OIO13392.1 MAG: hypothetical protein AUJ81_11495 [Helicobacteraceae bacterium CG1_02_36_14]PIP10372.1 MAG: hypothetical protein COX50_06125 [Sulfurimonas sp. CG23_combo_of_CG06-09_8_20_14_all_36_33]PIS23839.1 MAG: hypothetical protein COT46_11575 [Sulfurimonas sp. CG08_land_8_20_14_0_20_36_33]PIU35389.1 MAG: hypothetical protein COT05_03615 [Sulfurimonas sp. CG07_land_8_20_14_0_80_36_56]PIV03574.1 MAG: hypothetical protein COS56_07895 [Sulfur